MFLCHKFSKATLPKVSSSAALRNVKSLWQPSGVSTARGQNMSFSYLLCPVCACLGFLSTMYFVKSTAAGSNIDKTSK